ncbi:MAG: hypothetical protein ACRETL_07075 [Gammaproteobacteria bacterium]
MRLQGKRRLVLSFSAGAVGVDALLDLPPEALEMGSIRSASILLA